LEGGGNWIEPKPEKNRNEKVLGEFNGEADIWCTSTEEAYPRGGKRGRVNKTEKITGKKKGNGASSFTRRRPPWGGESNTIKLGGKKRD